MDASTYNLKITRLCNCDFCVYDRSGKLNDRRSFQMIVCARCEVINKWRAAMPAVIVKTPSSQQLYLIIDHTRRPYTIHRISRLICLCRVGTTFFCWSLHIWRNGKRPTANSCHQRNKWRLAAAGWLSYRRTRMRVIVCWTAHKRVIIGHLLIGFR